MAITRQRATELAQIRRQMGRLGGRPKGSLSPATIKKIKDKATFEAAARARAGRILNNLLLSSDAGDTPAGKEVLERAFGKVSQDMHLTGDFQMRTLHLVALPTIAEQSTDSASVAVTSVPLIDA